MYQEILQDKLDIEIANIKDEVNNVRKKCLAILILLPVLIIAFSFSAHAAAQWFTVQSKIGGTQYGATQELGRFQVVAGGQAYNFSGNANVISSAQNQQILYCFSIDRIGSGNQKSVTVFERSCDGKRDAPTALSQLRLGPGNYVLLVGGRPGSTAQITFYGTNVTRN